MTNKIFLKGKRYSPTTFFSWSTTRGHCCSWLSTINQQVQSKRYWGLWLNASISAD